MIDQTIRFTYLVVTSLSNFQTLGEEYTGILLVNNNYRSLPSRVMRIVMAVLQCYGYSMITKLLSYVEQYYIKENSIASRGTLVLKKNAILVLLLLTCG